MNNRKKGTVLRLVTYFKGLELKMAAVITSSILSAALFIASPIFLGKALDQLAEGIKSSLANGKKYNYYKINDLYYNY